MRCIVFILTFFCLVSLSAHADSGMLGWLSPKLREVERLQMETTAKLNALETPANGQTVPDLGYLHSNKNTNQITRWVQVDLKKSLAVDQVVLIPVQADFQAQETDLYGFPRRFRVDISDDPEFLKSHPLVNYDDADFPDPGISPVEFPAHGKTARYVRVTVVSPSAFAIAELMVLSGNLNIASGCRVTSSSAIEIPPRWHVDNLVDGRTPLGPPVVRRELLYDGVYAGPSNDEEEPTWMQLDLGKVMPVEEVRLHPVHASKGMDFPGYGFPAQFRLEVSTENEFRSPELVWDSINWQWFRNPGNNPVTIPLGNVQARFVRVVLVKAGGFIHAKRFGLSEIEIYSGGVNVARQAKPETVPDPTLKTKDWPRSILNDGFNSHGLILELPQWVNLWTQRSALQRELASLNLQRETLYAGVMKRAQWLFGGLSVLLLVGVVGSIWNGRRIRRRELEKFRRQLAHDLHDEIGSNLAAIGMISEAAARQPSQIEFLQRISQIAHETTDAMRETLWLAGFREEVGMNLMDHLKLAATRLLAGRKIEWIHELGPSSLKWSVEDRRQVFLFFKEALANVARHSEAEKVTLSASIENGFFELKIQDDGHGFSPDQTGGGMGINSLRERAAKLRGTMQLETALEKGTCVILRTQIRVKS